MFSLPLWQESFIIEFNWKVKPNPSLYCYHYKWGQRMRTRCVSLFVFYNFCFHELVKTQTPSWGWGSVPTGQRFENNRSWWCILGKVKIIRNECQHGFIQNYLCSFSPFLSQQCLFFCLINLVAARSSSTSLKQKLTSPLRTCLTPPWKAPTQVHSTLEPRHNFCFITICRLLPKSLWLESSVKSQLAFC